MPPHVYSVSDNAYADMLRNSENQSMLITGKFSYAKNNHFLMINFILIHNMSSQANLVPVKLSTPSVLSNILPLSPLVVVLVVTLQNSVVVVP